MHEAVLIQEYLAKHGARRFAQGSSGKYDSVRLYLLEKGWDMRRVQANFALKPVGKPGIGKRQSWQKIIEFVDELRVADGLEPLCAPVKHAA